jgi:hypothetical protein
MLVPSLSWKIDRFHSYSTKKGAKKSFCVRTERFVACEPVVMQDCVAVRNEPCRIACVVDPQPHVGAGWSRGATWLQADRPDGSASLPLGQARLEDVTGYVAQHEPARRIRGIAQLLDGHPWRLRGRHRYRVAGKQPHTSCVAAARHRYRLLPLHDQAQASTVVRADRRRKDRQAEPIRGAPQLQPSRHAVTSSSSCCSALHHDGL